MPLSTTLRKLLCCAPGRQEEEEAEMPPVRPLPERVEAGPVQPGRPYRDYVENEADRYWREMEDTGRRPREIPLPDHPAPKHPPIYYTVDPVTGRPVPTEDSLIRGDYVYDLADSFRITQDEYIRPWRDADWPRSVNDLTSRGGGAYYTFTTVRGGGWDTPWNAFLDLMKITYFWIEPIGGIPSLMWESDREVLTTIYEDRLVSELHFSPCPPSVQDIIRHQQLQDQMDIEMSG